MKVALVAENYFPTVGGIQEHVHHLAMYLRAAGHDARVVTGMPSVDRWIGPRDEEWVVRVGPSYRYGVMGTYTQATLGPGAFARLAELFRRERLDLVHVHNPFDVGLPAMVQLLYRGPLVATLHAAFRHTPWRSLLAPWYRWVTRRLAGGIAVSELAAATIRRYADFRYEVIPNGVDVSAFAAGRRLARFDGARNLLYLGRIEPRNGLDLLLEAMPAIVAAEPRVRLIVAGDGPMRAEYEARVPPPVAGRVLFVGAVEGDERPDLYASADVFVLPARFGGSFSILVLEALAAGVPVVSTPFVPPHQRDRHWDPVLLSDDESPRAIARAVVAALGESDAARALRVRLGRKVVARYDWGIVGGRVLGFYQRVLGEAAFDQPVGGGLDAASASGNPPR